MPRPISFLCLALLIAACPPTRGQGKREPAFNGTKLSVLIADLGSPLRLWRENAVAGILDIGPPAKGAVPNLLKAYEAESLNTLRHKYIEALRKIGELDEKCVKALAVYAFDPNQKELVESTRQEIIQTLIENDLELKQGAAILAGTVKEPHKVRLEIIRLIAKREAKAKQCEGELFKLLDDREMDIRIAGLQALIAIRPPDEMSLDVVRKVNRDRSPAVTKIVIDALAKSGPAEAERVVPLLEELADCTHPAIRLATVPILMAVDPTLADKRSHAVVQKYLKDVTAEVPMALFASLQKGDPKHLTPSIPMLAVVADHPRPEVRMAAVRLVLTINPEMRSDDCRKLIERAIVQVDRREVVDFATQLGPKGKELVATIDKIDDKGDPELRTAKSAFRRQFDSKARTADYEQVFPEETAAVLQLQFTSIFDLIGGNKNRLVPAENIFTKARVLKKFDFDALSGISSITLGLIGYNAKVSFRFDGVMMLRGTFPAKTFGKILEDDDGVYAACIAPDCILVSTSREMLVEAMERSLEPKRTALKDDLQTLIKKTEPLTTMFSAASTLSDDLRKILDRPDAPKGMKSLLAKVYLSKGKVELQIEFETENKADADEWNDLIAKMIPVAKELALWKPQLADPLKTLIKSLAIEQKGNSVVVTANVSENQAKAILRELFAK